VAFSLMFCKSRLEPPDLTRCALPLDTESEKRSGHFPDSGVPGQI
jgi:hypothetical protein